MASHTTNQGSNQNWAGGKENGSDGCCECQRVFELLADVEAHLSKIEQQLEAVTVHDDKPAKPERQYYGVAEFAKLVNRSEYSVREWCRLHRINAEKCEAGHGDSKAWKIPASELARYLDHGLLLIPSKY